MNPPVIIEHEGIKVARDDLLLGGTKSRVLPVLFNGADEYVYASPVFGYAQVALAITAREHGKRATVFCAKRSQLHKRTLEAQRAMAKIVQVPVGYMSVVLAQAKYYCAMNGACLLPFGLDTAEFISALCKVALSIDVSPTEVWCAAGSGVLTRSLQQAWPNARHCVVRVGAEPDAGKAEVWVAPERFENDAKIVPPFPSCSNYDAKVWQFIKRYATPGALFWNVAA